jgi:branched-chain amino acid transport system permease protein
VSPYVLDIITNCGINVLVAIGLYVTVLSGQLSAGHAALMGIGGYVSGYLLINTGIPLTGSVTCAVLAGMLFGGFLAVSLLRLEGFYMPIGTLAAAQALVSVANNLRSVGAADGLSGIPLQGGVRTAVISAALVVVGTRFWERSLGGLNTRALGQDSLAAQVCGVNRTRVRVVAFACGGAIAAYAGALRAGNTGIVVPDDLGFMATMALFFYIGIGGITGYMGATVGAIAVTVLPEVLRFSIYDRYLYFGTALCLIMILRPHGVIPRVPLGHAKRYLRWLGVRRQAMVRRGAAPNASH